MVASRIHMLLPVWDFIVSYAWLQFIFCFVVNCEKP